MVKDPTKRKLSAMVVGKSLVGYRIIATFLQNGWMQLMIHTGKYMTQLGMSQVPLLMKTVSTTGSKYIKRSMYSRIKFNIFVTIEISGKKVNFRL